MLRTQVYLSVNSQCSAAKLETFLILPHRTANLHPKIGRVNGVLSAVYTDDFKQIALHCLAMLCGAVKFSLV